MDIKLNLEQKQALSQRMIQCVKILQMSAQELEEYVENLALENPVIDIVQPTPPADADVNLQALRKYEWLNSLDSQNSASYYQQESPDEERDEEYNFPMHEEETLRDYLWSQLVTSDFKNQDQQILKYMLESLNSRGYMTEELSDVEKRFHITAAHAKKLLAILQELDPAGICARDLSECLRLQAERLGIMTPVLKEILAHHLEQVAKNQLPQIAKQMKISLDQVSDCCKLIKQLNPTPGSTFYSRDQLSYILPDVTLVKFPDHFEILLNEYLYPNIQVNGYYRRLAHEQQDPETTSYLLGKIRQAEWVRDCISKRNTTLIDVSKAILEFQEEFFTSGSMNLKPLRLVDVAEKLSIHESTVSRAVHGKYLQCAWGIYPMNFFFSKGIASPEAKEKRSVTQIKQELQELVDGEDRRKPFSDRALAEELARRDISISRRTVAKYRQEMGIADAVGRKKYD